MDANDHYAALGARRERAEAERILRAGMLLARHRDLEGLPSIAEYFRDSVCWSA